MKKKLLSFGLLAAGLLTAGNVNAEDKTYATVYTNDCSATTGWTTTGTASTVAAITTNALTEGDTYVNFKTDNGKDRNNYLPLSTLNTNFSTTDDYIFEFDLKIYGSNANGHLAHLDLIGTTDKEADTLFSVNCTSYSAFALISGGDTIKASLADIVTSNAKGTRDTPGAATIWSHWTVKSNATDGTTLTVELWSNGSKTSYITETKLQEGIFNIGNITLHGGSYQQWSIDNISLSIYSEDIITPAADMTGVNGTGRIITMSQAAGQDIYYYLCDDDSYDYSSKTATKYESPITINETSYLAIYATDGTNKSDVVTYTFEAGSTVALNAPSYTISMTENGSVYNATISAETDNSDVLFSPTATLTATFDGTEVSLPYTATSEGTLVITAAADGYESSSVSFDLAESYSIKTTTDDFGTINSSNIESLLGSGYTAVETPTRWSNWTKKAGYNLDGTANSDVADGYYFYSITSGSTFYDLFTVSGADVILNVGYGFMSSGSERNIEISNAAEKSIAEFVVNYGRGGTTADVSEFAFASDGKITYTLGKAGYPYVAQIKYYVPAEEETVETITVTTASLKQTYSNMDYDVTFPVSDNVGAYVASSYANDSVKMTRIYEVPAGTGVVLVAKSAENNSVEITKTAASGSSYSRTNLLKAADGSDVAISEEVDGTTVWNYILYAEDGKYYYLSEAGAIAAGKAYLQIARDPNASSSAKGVKMIFDGESTTGINEVNAAAKSGKIYNLQGIEVKNASNGLYIVNGKKVIK